jgi:hypothetical protein
MRNKGRIFNVFHRSMRPCDNGNFQNKKSAEVRIYIHFLYFGKRAVQNKTKTIIPVKSLSFPVMKS